MEMQVRFSHSSTVQNASVFSGHMLQEMTQLSIVRDGQFCFSCCHSEHYETCNIMPLASDMLK